MSKNRAIKKWQLERKLRSAVADANAHLRENPEADRDTVLKSKVSRALDRHEFLERVGNKDTDPWHTGCYNQLNEVTVYGTDKSNKLNSSLSHKNNFWNTPIRIDNISMFPEAKLPWFENRQSGDFVWGSNRDGNEGRPRGINGKIYNSYQGDDMTFGSGGAPIRFTGKFDDWLKHILKAIKTGNGAFKRGKNISTVVNQQINDTISSIRDLTPAEKRYIMRHPEQDSMAIKNGLMHLHIYQKVLPKIEHWNGDFHLVAPEVDADTLIRPSDRDIVEEMIDKRNKRTRRETDKRFRNGEY